VNWLDKGNLSHLFVSLGIRRFFKGIQKMDYKQATFNAEFSA